MRALACTRTHGALFYCYIHGEKMKEERAAKSGIRFRETKKRYSADVNSFRLRTLTWNLQRSAAELLSQVSLPKDPPVKRGPPNRAQLIFGQR